MKLFFMLSGLLLLTACTSSPNPLNYYVLHSPQSMTTPRDHGPESYIKIDTIRLPGYLQRPNLCMQTSEVEVHFAPQHVWANAFHEDFRQALSQQLYSQHNIVVDTNTGDYAQRSSVSVAIEIYDFLPTYDGKVLLSGHFSVTTKVGVKNKQFMLESKLEKNGFAQSVKQMRQLIAELSDELAQSL